VDRLRDVLELLAEGYTNARIARALGISENAARTRVRALYADLGARDRAHAVALGFRCGALGGPRHRSSCASNLPRPCDCGVDDRPTEERA
jgi:DNA-binding CsgD family transcriptional regulator